MFLLLKDEKTTTTKTTATHTNEQQEFKRKEKKNVIYKPFCFTIDVTHYRAHFVITFYIWLKDAFRIDSVCISDRVCFILVVCFLKICCVLFPQNTRFRFIKSRTTTCDTYTNFERKTQTNKNHLNVHTFEANVSSTVSDKNVLFIFICFVFGDFACKIARPIFFLCFFHSFVK